MTALLTAARLVLVATGLALLGIAGYASRNRSGTALRPFVALMVVLGSLAIADGLAAANATALSLVWLVAYLAIPTVFAWFVVEYYGLPHLASRRRALAFAAPAVLAVAGGAVVVSEPSMTGAMFGSGATGRPASMPGMVLSAARLAEQVGMYYAGGAMLAGTALLVRTTRAYEHLDGRLGVVLSSVPVWPWLAYLLTPAFVGTYPQAWLVAGTATGYLSSAGVAAFAVTRGGLLDAAPAAGTLGPEAVLEHLEDVVVVVDRDGTVVRVNGSAQRVFDAAPAEVVGAPLASVVGADLDDVGASGTLDLATAEGTRTFAAMVTTVRDRHGRAPGYAVVLRDVTGERVRAQRLGVLNRVLRHNLRNEMSAVIGQAQVIAAETDDHDDTAADIVDAAEDLVELGERAQEIERMMSVDADGDATTVVADVVDEVLSPYRDRHPRAAISADVPASLTAAVDGRVLAQVLDNLVENALVHNDAPTSIVSVSARESGDGVSVSVADNGPGLPTHERVVLEDGEESPLSHGSGLGLWAVAWGTTRMGGELTFTDNQPRGTVVTLSLPTASSPTGAPTTAEAGAD